MNPLPHILLVEDNPSDVMMAREAFAEENLLNRIDVAENGIAAIDYLNNAETLPALILLDLNLPKMNGREVLRTIKQDERLRMIPVVILTTSNFEKDIAECYALQAASFIIKPVDFAEFVTIVRSLNNYWFKTVTLPDL